MTKAATTPEKVLQTASTKDQSEELQVEQTQEVKFVYLPPSITPLEQYEAELRRAGYSEELVNDIVEGLADSPLYESQTPQ